MGTNINLWSKTAGTNATADSNINWQEGQAPSTVNNSARFMMAADANDRDDTRHQLSTATSTTAYTITTNSGNTTYQNGLMVSAKIHATSTGACTLNVDGIGARKQYDATLTQINTGGLLIGQHATWTYNTALDGAAGGFVLVSGPAVVPTTAITTLGNTSNVAEVTVASAGTTDILGAASNLVAISGTNTITSLGTGINKLKAVRFTGALILTHNATSLILPGAANITTVAGDTMIIESDASSNVRVLSYMRGAQVPYTTGTWTPGVSFGGGTTGITYTTQTGYYTRIGRAILLNGTIVLSSKGSSTGTALVTGLPFTSNASGDTGGVAFTRWSGMASLSSGIIGLIQNSATTMSIATGGTITVADLDNTNFTNTATLRFTGHYVTD